MYLQHTPLSMQEMYFGKSFVNDTVLKTKFKSSITDSSTLQYAKPDYSQSMRSINTPVDTGSVNTAKIYAKNNSLIMVGFAILIGFVIYYVYQQIKIQKEKITDEEKSKA